MNKITFPLKQQMQGPAVADLQDALQQCLERKIVFPADDTARRELTEALKPERAGQVYGSATAKLVSTLQDVRSLPASGEVDEPTAKVLNELLQGWGMFDTPATAVRIVSGAVRREDGVPLHGVRVRARHETDSGPILLGEHATDAQGRYTIRYEPLPSVDGINLRVVAVDEDGEPLQSSEVTRNAKALEIVDFTLPVDRRPTAQRRIEGQVVLEHGLPASQLKLRLYRLDFGGTGTLLKESSTLAGGHYAFAYDAGATAASLQVRAVNAAGEEIPLSHPFDDLGGESRAGLNLVAPASLQPPAAEYRRLSGDLSAQVGAMTKLAGARENGERRDLTVLNRATGWDARLIALAATTERLAAEPDVQLPSEPMYGLLRAGLPSEKLTLAQVEPEVVEQALKTARDAGIVELSDQQIAEFKTQFHTFATRVRLNLPAPGSRASYGQLLGASGLSADAQAKFASVYLGHRGDRQQLWGEARKAGLGDADISKLQLQGKLAFLAGNSEGMTARMMRKEIDDPAQLVEQDLYRADAWMNEVLAHAEIPLTHLGNLTEADKKKLEATIPSRYAGGSVEDRLRAYTEDMARKVSRSYPTHVIGRLIEQDAIPLPASRNDTVTLLRNAAGQGFRLGETPVENFFKTHAGARAGMTDGDFTSAQQQVKTLQRIYQITPSNEAMPVLLGLKMTSAYDVTAYPQAEFTALYEAKYAALFGRKPPPSEARLVYRKARQVSSVTYNLFAMAGKLESEAPVAGLSAPPTVRESVRAELLKQFPSMESLFGSLDFCECEHCRSVLSPAAYLVDLLQFVDPEAREWENFLARWKATHADQDYPHPKPYDILIGRRPDLPHLALTCENTHTALPYIDIVNEVLEYYVAHGKLAPDAVHDTGGATTAELLAEPQNVIQDAYERLRKARYTMTLPFDLWAETIREFCDRLETPLPRLMDVLRPTDELFAAAAFDRSSIFMASLGLSPTELAIFTDTNPLAAWHELYGYADAQAATTDAVDADTGQRIDLNSAKTLARRLGVTYNELTEIIQTPFVNPHIAKLSVLFKLGLSIHDARFYLDHKGLIAQDPATLSDEDRKLQLEAQALARKLTDAQVSEGDIQAIPFDDVLVLADPAAGGNFDLTTLRYADGGAADDIAFLRINLFVRLWRKLGWTIEETGRALEAFVPPNAPFEPAHFDRQPLKTALIYLAHLKTLEETLRLGKKDRLRLLTLWSDLPITGKNPLYAQLFLSRSVLKNDKIFDDPRGHYLSGAPGDLIDHLLAVQGALGLDPRDIGAILEDAGQTLDTAELSLPNLSLLHRYALLARALKLPVRALIALKQLSGLDPFTPLHPEPLADTPPGVSPAKKAIELDHPFTQTLRFVEIAQEVRDSGLDIEALDYLFRHRADDAGKHHPNADTTRTLLKTLAEGIRGIRDEHSLPTDPAAMTDDVVRQKLSLALAPDIVSRVLAMMNGTIAFTIAEAQSFFETHLLKRAPEVPPGGGFMDAGDFALLFDSAPGAGETSDDLIRKRRTRLSERFLPYLQQRLIRRLVIETLTAHTGGDPALIESLLTDTRLTAGAAPLLDSFAAIGQTGLAADFFDSDDGSGPRQPTVPVVADADTQLKPARDADGNPLNPANSARFEGYLEVATSGAYRFNISLEKKDARAELRFHHLPNPVFLHGTASAENSVLGNGANEFLELKANVFYRFTLDLTQLNGGTARLLVQGETVPRGAMSQLMLYPVGVFDGAERAAVLLTKLLQLAQGLALNEREIRYLLTHGAAFDGVRASPTPFDGVRLSELPTRAGETTPARAISLFGKFLRWAAYARLKRTLAGGSDALIAIFEANESTATDKLDAKVYPLIAQLTRRDEATVKATAESLAGASGTPAFESERPLYRLWDALQVVERFGVPAAALLEWTRVIGSAADGEPRFETARDAKAAIKARLDAHAWQRVAQPIFDRLRRRQRDALAAHVMHQQQFTSIEKLYEHFLIDPGMEPVVQTSRIRLAIASVQLFIQRSLLNMEAQVHPAVINSRHWEWMKRYRVWEANRKIFLFPENWLEPEFRDDKTHLFGELEAALLEDDVSGDRAEDVFLDYLKKLDELARLEIVAMHMEDAQPAARVLHVIGRTYGKPHKHFYRRHARQMWTPWEPVNFEIQGDHLAPVVWRDRLYLFWVTFMDKPVREPQFGSSTGNQSLSQAKLSTVIRDVSAAGRQKHLDVQLHWNEYVAGEWSTPESSGFVPVTTTTHVPGHWERARVGDTRPVTADGKVWVEGADYSEPLLVAANFDPASVFVHVSREPYEEGEERGVYIHLRGSGVNQAFYMAGRNAAPEAALCGDRPANPLSSASRAIGNRYGGSGALTVEFRRHIRTEDGRPPVDTVEVSGVLQRCNTYELVPCDSAASPLPAADSPDDDPAVAEAIQRGLPEIAALMQPVFFQDKAHTLFVEPSVTERTIEEWQDWVSPTPQPERDWRNPHWWNNLTLVAEHPRTNAGPDSGGRSGTFDVDPGSLINPKPRVDWLVNPATALEFDGVLIGPSGRPGLEIRRTGDSTDGGSPVNVHPAGGLAAGSTLVVTAPDGVMRRSGLTRPRGGLNVIGSGGFNAALARNLAAASGNGFGFDAAGVTRPER